MNFQPQRAPSDAERMRYNEKMVTETKEKIKNIFLKQK